MRADAKLEDHQALTGRMADGSEAQIVHRVVGDQLDVQSDTVVKTIFRKINDSDVLTGEEAVQAWIQLHAIHQLREKLAGKERAGIAAAGKLDRSLREAPAREARRKARRRFIHT